MAVLLLRLAAPLQAWGGSAKFEVRTTQREPTKSGVIGLLAASLGIPRDADLSKHANLSSLRFGIRVEREGKLLRDFHTARSEDGKTAYITERYYLSDAIFLAALESENTVFLETLAHALKHPVYPLFLGRRSCPPTLPLLLGIREGTLMQVLRDEPKLEKSSSMRIVCDAAENGFPVQDVPVSFSPLHRKHKFRMVQEEILFSDEHDPMAEL
ncbi:MAG: type I-E CRISPR-associated protein Cas5/CasD [Ruminococcus sp.]|nr:type I-E CRISPR-associated protein Cas5/CasD [Ruminococcus sp.]